MYSSKTIVSKAEIVVFPKLFAQVEEWLATHTVFIVKGIVDSSTQATKLKAQSLIPIDLLFEQPCERITLHLPDALDPEILTAIKEVCVPGTSALELHFVEDAKRLTLKAKEKIKLTQEFVTAVELLKVQIRLTLIIQKETSLFLEARFLDNVT